MWGWAFFALYLLPRPFLLVPAGICIISIPVLSALVYSGLSFGDFFFILAGGESFFSHYYNQLMTLPCVELSCLSETTWRSGFGRSGNRLDWGFANREAAVRGIGVEPMAFILVILFIFIYCEVTVGFTVSFVLGGIDAQNQ